jgi:hypothetical protein
MTFSDEGFRNGPQQRAFFSFIRENQTVANQWKCLASETGINITFRHNLIEFLVCMDGFLQESK